MIVTDGLHKRSGTLLPDAGDRGSRECSLNRLAPGRHAVVQRVEGEARVRQRLLEMGLTCGVRLQMVRSAPLGDPVEVRVRGYHLSLRRQEAQSITVTHDE